MDLVNTSDLYRPAIVGEDFIAEDVFDQILFESPFMRIPYNFTLLSDNVTDVARAFSVYCLVLVDNKDLPPNHFPHQTTVVIVDSDSEFTL